MEHRADGHFYETAILDKPGHRTERTEPIDIVVGSGKKGQTYLYWKDDRLFELPVSFWSELNHWVNSPGYVDGSSDFERTVTPRCLECHAAYFRALPEVGVENRFDKTDFVLGITCERCHGPGREHVEKHTPGHTASSGEKIVAPTGLAREAQIDICAQCHGGVGKELAAAFSFLPGEELAKYVKLVAPDPDARVDVHGNQVALLERSRCYQSSPNMTCTTCHDVHASERPAASYSEKCVTCHQPDKCGMYRTLGNKIAANCVDCHMPVEESSALVTDVEEQRIGAKVRNHWIKIYPKSSR
jgi:hypothetical protein